MEKASNLSKGSQIVKFSPLTSEMELFDNIGLAKIFALEDGME